MMSRNFTTREKVLLIVLAVMLLGILYYWFIVRDVDNTIEKYQTDDLEIDLLIEQTKAQKIVDMNAEMKGSSTGSGTVASYNNIKNEIEELNGIFSSAATYNFDFGTAVRDGDAVRRDISIMFTASSYSAAESIVQQLHDCKYRCVIRDINITAGTGAAGSNVSGSLKVTFFETMYNADTTDGLETADNEENKSGKTE